MRSFGLVIKETLVATKHRAISLGENCSCIDSRNFALTFASMLLSHFQIWLAPTYRRSLDAAQPIYGDIECRGESYAIQRIVPVAWT